MKYSRFSLWSRTGPLEEMTKVWQNFALFYFTFTSPVSLLIYDILLNDNEWKTPMRPKLADIVSIISNLRF